MQINKTCLTGVMFCLFFISSNAQTYVENFGKANLAELAMTSYNLDKTAEAVVIYDIGQSYFYDVENYGFQVIYERSTKIRIFTKAGLDYATIEIPYYLEKAVAEKVIDIEGYTYNLENGMPKVSKLDMKTIYEENVNQNWNNKKFVMPDVREGSVIEFRYKVMSPYLFNLQDWAFQWRIPVISSEYTVKMIPFYEYTYIFQGAKKFDVLKNTQGFLESNYAGVIYKDNIFTFGMKNVQPFRDEAYITSMNDYIIKMDFQLSVIHRTDGAKINYITTWPALLKELSKTTEFGIYQKALSNNAASILTSLQLETKSAEEKAEAVYKYVTMNYNWNGYYGKFATQSGKDFLKAKTGNTADVNLFLAALLNTAGIQANPVLISTRDHGKIYKNYPFEKFLNYVIVMVRINDKQILLDATEPLCPFGVLPSRCINETGLIANKEEEEWINIDDNSLSELNDTIKLSFNSTVDSLYAAHSMSVTGHDALSFRARYLKDQSSLDEEFLAEGVELKDGLEILNERSIDQPFIMKFRQMVAVEMAGDKIFVTPFAGIVPEENPLKLSYRSYPVDMTYKQSRNLMATIDIPNGYKYVPEDNNFSSDNNATNIQYKVEVSGNQLKINASYIFKKSVFPNTDYFDLKNSFAKIVENFNRKIVLVKAQEF